MNFNTPGLFKIRLLHLVTFMCQKISPLKYIDELSFLPVVGVQSQLRIPILEDISILQEPKLLSRLREMKLHNTTHSEGYETMTQHSSDIVSEVNAF